MCTQALHEPDATQELLDSLLISPEHVRKALTMTNPSTLRESAIEVPNIKWEDIGGLEATKKDLIDRILDWKPQAEHLNRPSPAQLNFPACRSACVRGYIYHLHATIPTANRSCVPDV